MGKYTKTIGCKVEQWVFDKIQIIGATPTEYLRNLIYNDLKNVENTSKSEVNHLVNNDDDTDETFGIDKRVDLILKRLNK